MKATLKMLKGVWFHKEDFLKKCKTMGTENLREKLTTKGDEGNLRDGETILSLHPGDGYTIVSIHQSSYNCF